MVELTAKIAGMIFSNRATGFHVLRVVPEDGSGPVVARGNFNTALSIGLKAQLTGSFENHERYGRELVVSSCKVIPDKDRSGVVVYLVANVPSIGPITAGKMYDALGDDLLRLLDEDPQRVAALPFLTRPQAVALVKEWSEASETRTASIFLAGLGLGPTLIRSVFTHFTLSGARGAIQENPYRLTEVPGVGFVIADQAARKLGIGVDDVRRVRAMILFAMSELSASDGHMFCTSGQVQEYVERRLFNRHAIDPFSHGRYIADHRLYSSIVDLQEDGSVKADGERLYLSRHWLDEYGIAEALAPAISRGPVVFEGLDGILADFEREHGLELSDEQREAFMALDRARVITVSGFPGTGKTLLISAFVHLFEQVNLQYSLMSPTGIAAKRLSKVTGKPASTIHRALGYKPDGTWEFNRLNRYDVDAVIVDEMSMVDSSTFHHLVSALSPRTIVVMVGDSAQLPSVGAGHVLHHLMECDVVPHVALTRIYRQEEASDIIKTAHAILRGRPVDTSFRSRSEFVFLNIPQEEVVSNVCGLTEAMKERGRIFQVIAPVYDGELGVNSLNNHLRDVLNPGSKDPGVPRLAGREVRYGEKEADPTLCVGDRVMVTKNDYNRAVFNGDVGKVTSISLRDDEVRVRIFDWYDQEARAYVKKELSFKVEEARQVLKVAFACTIHKCVSPNTLVETPDGLRRISSIPDTGLVSTPSGSSAYRSKVENPPSRMLRITTSDGYALEVTPDHGMEVWDAELGYVRRDAKDVAVGDVLPLKLGSVWGDQPVRDLPKCLSGHPNEVVHRVPKLLDEDMAEFLGLMVADGTVWESGFRLVKSSPDVVDRFVELCSALFGAEAKRFVHGGTDAAEVDSTQLSRWLLSIGGLAPKEKYVPDAVLASSLAVQARFLRGLFEDGTVNVDPDRGCSDHIELVTRERSIHDDVKVMLLRFGIISGTGTRVRTLSDGLEHTYKVVYVYGCQVKKFANLIGFISKFKQDRADLPHGTDRNYQVPVLKREALSLRDANGGPPFFTLTDKNVLTRHRMSRGQLASLLERAAVKDGAYSALEERIGWHHSAVESVEPVLGPSACVEVPDGHKFVQNGFCAWNCQGQEYDYVIMPMTSQYGIMLYRNLVYTAITRARKKVYVMGDPRAFLTAVANEREMVRNSNLSALIVDCTHLETVRVVTES